MSKLFEEEETRYEMLPFLKGRGMVMCKTFTSIFLIFLFIAIGLCGQTKATDMTITNLFPAANATEICYDTKLWITFDTTPIMATDSTKHLQIRKVSGDLLVYDVNLRTLPSDGYGPIATGWPASYVITQQTRAYNYEPFKVSGKTVEIYPSVHLEYNTQYYVTMTGGFCTDANGYTSPDINNINTTWRFTTKATAPTADHDYTVALDGSGDFYTLQGASDAVANNDATRTIIKIKKGTYRELLNIPTSKINITWLGEDRDTTILAAYNFNGFNPAGSDYRNIMRLAPTGLRIYNMTFHNLRPKAGGNNQAEITKNSCMKNIMQNCKFMSFQDTLCLNGQHYFKDCYIEGDTDFIWNTGVVYFDNCELHLLSTQSHVTQTRTTNGTNGFFFVDCNLTCPAGLNNCDLGRMTLSNGVPSAPYGQAAFINCIMPKTLIIPQGWRPSSPDDLTNRRWWEYKSVEPNGTLINVSQRINPGSVQLSDACAVWWRDINHVFSASPWNPKNLGELPSAAWQPYPVNGGTGANIAGITLTWATGAGATSHDVYFGTVNPPPSIGNQTGTSFATGTMSDGVTYYWRVDEKNSTGTTTGEVWSFTAATMPTPSSMTFDTAPYAASYTSIAMVATTASSSFGVEYYFTCTGGGGHNSGWQDSTTYTDTALLPSTTYTYTVKARDKSTSHNETAASAPASATTLDDVTAPTPNPMTFATAPYAMSDSSIRMVATTAADISGVEYYFTCTAGGGHNSGWQTSSTYTDTGLAQNSAYTYTVKAHDKSAAHNETADSNALSATTLLDVTPPSPSSMSFNVAPHGTDFHSISMTAATATDNSGVEYYFTCTAGGGHDSGWQDSTTYTDTGLTEGSICSYIVTARDKSPQHNANTPSAPAAGQTVLDAAAPTPNPMTWATVPHVISSLSITMVASTATDNLSGVEYYFANITDPNHNSGWQDSTTYTDIGLTNKTTYTYRVKARDKSFGHNETGWSNDANAMAQYVCSGTIASDLDKNCEVDFVDFALMASHWGEAPPLNNNIAVNGTFDTDIIPGWHAFDLPSAVGTFIFIYDGGYGDPVGAAGIGTDTDITGASGHYAYQVLPVKTGKQYKLSAEWFGDLSGYGTVTSDPCHLSNWGQVLVSFETNADANTWTVWTNPNAVIYEKVFGVATKNVDSSGTWSWEPITASNTNGPADGVFTASGDYMVVAFSEGGLPGSGLGYFYIDNVKVEKSACSPADLNGDCNLDWLDIEQFATDWLTCNRVPSSECGL